MPITNEALIIKTVESTWTLLGSVADEWLGQVLQTQLTHIVVDQVQSRGKSKPVGAQ